MLNAETKRKIQGLRDTLVGKIPVPTDQVKQITLGLIYKFMSDIDKENTDILGGKSFFNGDYDRYSWNNIIDKSLSSYERVTLYSEGLEKMSLNPNIPELFRDIFRNAYLPFRDPATLSQFLIGINEFTYDHSEDLGDAFEFLLSIMGSQGDAGQFRTPRHIIDFIVKVVEPKKTDRILDPACGTAGFLISAYKYILENNKTSDSDKPGSALSLTEKNKLTDNFVGYDISTDMVRLSLVNMYLHNFANPNIKEYDTLTSEELWDEDFDCIMANPPFMTPKGGIRPHKRFAIRANRSEVLFVDYIAEHLMPNGKAGVIVPEGIIFQSSNAYKALRKMLVEDNYLYAVVSLPAGVFQPYSGVKTSILFMDKILAGKTGNILFVKIENDGFDLGAQRREIDKNDLPKALEIILDYKKSILDNKEFDLKEKNKESVIITSKEKIRESRDYNLSADQYRPIIEIDNKKWPLVELKKICKILNGYAFKSHLFNDQKSGIPIIRIRDINSGFSETYYRGDYDDKYIVNNGDLLIGMDGDFVATLWKHGKSLLNQRVCRLENFINANKEYVYYLVQKELDVIHKNTYAVTVKHLSSRQIEKIKIPLPPLEIQQEIVEELNKYQTIIDGAKQVVENYQPNIEIDSSWELIDLGNQELFDIESGGTPDSNKNEYWNGDIPWITLIDLPTENFVTFINDTVRKISLKGLKNSSAKIIPKGSVLISTRATIGRVAINLIELATNQGFKNIIIRNKSKINPKFLAFLMTKKTDEMLILSSGGTFKEISKTNLSKIKVPIPSIKEQNNIISKIDEELQLIESNKRLIEIYKKKIREKISRI